MPLSWDHELIYLVILRKQALFCLDNKIINPLSQENEIISSYYLLCLYVYLQFVYSQQVSVGYVEMLWGSLCTVGRACKSHCKPGGLSNGFNSAIIIGFIWAGYVSSSTVVTVILKAEIRCGQMNQTLIFEFAIIILWSQENKSRFLMINHLIISRNQSVFSRQWHILTRDLKVTASVETFSEQWYRSVLTCVDVNNRPVTPSEWFM